MNTTQIEAYKSLINKADRIIVHLSDKAYLYDGIFQYKFHEDGYWQYMDTYESNFEYIISMYSINSIKSIELLFKDSNLNKTLYSN